MKPEDLDRTLARKTHQSRAQARDEIDVLVQEILMALREGRPVDLPGMEVLIGDRPASGPARGNPRKGFPGNRKK